MDGIPKSCDTFVVLPPNTANGLVVFGKNSDRPRDEVQEVIYQKGQDHPDGAKLKCTYVEIDQAPHTYAVILSKPAWMWGAEMGANEKGVCVGNEAVWTKLNGADDETEKLLGMDLVRLGLERGASAEEALEVITSLLEKHGQGGQCSDAFNFTYHNSFLIADPKEAWVLETAGQLWAAERVTSGCRNISNTLSIGTNIDKMSSALKEHAQKEGFWDGQGDFNFSSAYGVPSESAVSRQKCGRKLLDKFSSEGCFSLQHMASVLRDRPSGICMTGSFVSTSSQVSILSASDGRPSCHWFTGTPNPLISVFKPFIFTPNVRISPHIQSPVYPDEEDPAKVVPRFQKQVDREHRLYKLHKVATASKEDVVKLLRELEAKCVEDMDRFLENFAEDQLPEVDDLFKDIVETEIKFYK